MAPVGAHKAEWACLRWPRICLGGDMEKGHFRLSQKQVEKPRGGTVLGELLESRRPGVGGGGRVCS